MTPRRRTSAGSSTPCCFISSQVRWITREPPDSPANMGGAPQMALLLDRRGLGVALRDDDAAQVRAVLAGHVLPDRLAFALAEIDLTIGLGLGEEDAPAVVGHLHVAELGPAVGRGAGGG